MTNSKSSGRLSSQDFNDIVAFNHHILNCRQRSELKALLHDRILPLLRSQACIYFFTEPDLSRFAIYDTVNIPEETLSLLPHMFSRDPLAPMFLSGHRSVIAYDVDLDRGLVNKNRNQFFIDNPQFEPLRSIYVDSVSTGMVALNLPNANVGLAVHRWYNDDCQFTLREVRILELLWPSIMQTIRSILLSEELNRYRSFTDCLADISSPIVLIDSQGKLLYHNKAYGEIFPQSSLTSCLPQDLMGPTLRIMNNFRFDTDIIEPAETSFFNFGNRAYRISVARVDVGSGHELCYLLRLDPVVDAYVNFIWHLQSKDLSPREIEVCQFMKDGMTPREAAARLFVSYNTIRTHLKKIYLKLDVNTQAQLSIYLNKTP
ncbi:LuxR C-terminal-related transcriptional regulator [Chrysiogenes arsenatis]|uniref:LuxR C-terminal-related transcriptional regulator n=1 Tax=Chrysiogenes arsenatis TaxID=309797 RepID=UPI0003FD2725|nr:LuxR C-terminal-related transcriptional regulator [Chrysiogenes arsenatis]